MARRAIALATRYYSRFHVVGKLHRNYPEGSITSPAISSVWAGTQILQHLRKILNKNSPIPPWAFWRTVLNYLYCPQGVGLRAERQKRTRHLSTFVFFNVITVVHIIKVLVSRNGRKNKDSRENKSCLSVQTYSVARTAVWGVRSEPSN